jgi:hypothetical protein
MGSAAVELAKEIFDRFPGQNSAHRVVAGAMASWTGAPAPRAREPKARAHGSPTVTFDRAEPTSPRELDGIASRRQAPGRTFPSADLVVGAASRRPMFILTVVDVQEANARAPRSARCCSSTCRAASFRARHRQLERSQSLTNVDDLEEAWIARHKGSRCERGRAGERSATAKVDMLNAFGSNGLDVVPNGGELRRIEAIRDREVASATSRASGIRSGTCTATPSSACTRAHRQQDRSMRR